MGDITIGSGAQKPKSKIQLRIEAARAELAAQRGKLTADDLTEIAEREELAKVEAEKAEEKAVELALARGRWLDAAREKHGPTEKLSVVSIEGREDSFILRLNAIAYKKWDKSINDSAGNTKIDPQEERRKLCASCIVDWNGDADLAAGSLTGPRLTMYLSDNQGVVAPLIQEICVMAGVVKETRKSTG